MVEIRKRQIMTKNTELFDRVEFNRMPIMSLIHIYQPFSTPMIMFCEASLVIKNLRKLDEKNKLERKSKKKKKLKTI